VHVNRNISRGAHKARERARERESERERETHTHTESRTWAPLDLADPPLERVSAADRPPPSDGQVSNAQC
jgi:hypothetical protein